ncbi:hypothetical protein TEA_004899 [Camellia sinensis var. sinensis]|uniref:Uncharacterized protein n=1 Tax=Camellia sinensis var. sinensis TaxID=542762 RepID=A0A4S4CYU6_CAMSN|nr:hypothetical protein TEA_004899 [Camellia sinensis var. sinensis]
MEKTRNEEKRRRSRDVGGERRSSEAVPINNLVNGLRRHRPGFYRELSASLSEEHPDAETVKTAGCPIYRQLCTLFSEPGTNGEYNGSAEQEIPCPKPLTMFQEEPSSEDAADMEDENDKFQSMTPSGSTVGRKRGRKGVDDAIANAILEMASASKLRAAAIQQVNDRFSITDCVKVLDEMQGVDERVYFAALDLFNNPKARETFLSLKVDKRLTWLCSKCSSLSSS